MTGITELLGLISTGAQGAFLAIPSPEITAQAMEARKPKENKDFTGIQDDGSNFAARNLGLVMSI